MAVGLQAELTRERKPCLVALRFSFEDEVVVILEGTDDISAGGDLIACEVVLGRMIDVAAGNGHIFSGFTLVNLRMHSVRMSSPAEIKVVGDELIRALIFGYYSNLPVEEISHYLALESFVFSAETGVDSLAYIREIVPVIHAVGPVIKSEFVVEFFDIREFLLHVLYEELLGSRTTGIIRMSFIVKLVADHTFSSGNPLHKLTDDPFTVFSVDR